jgi:hypothetical protein
VLAIAYDAVWHKADQPELIAAISVVKPGSSKKIPKPTPFLCHLAKLRDTAGFCDSQQYEDYATAIGGEADLQRCPFNTPTTPRCMNLQPSGVGHAFGARCVKLTHCS